MVGGGGGAIKTELKSPQSSLANAYPYPYPPTPATSSAAAAAAASAASAAPHTTILSVHNSPAMRCMPDVTVSVVVVGVVVGVYQLDFAFMS